MPYQATAYKVMIASPSDVSEERDIAEQVVKDWNIVNSDLKRIILLPIRWESHTAPEMGDRPQGIINKQILANCDLLIGIFGTRLGSPTGQYESGTVEEISEHIKQNKPAMLYFSNANIPRHLICGSQLEALEKFKTSCKELGLIEEYADLDIFRAKFSRQLSLIVSSHKYFLKDDNSKIVFTESPIQAQTTTYGISDKAVSLLKDSSISISSEAIYLLKEASLDSHGIILYLDYLGGSEIATNDKQIYAGNDPRQLAVWNEAIEVLEKFELIADDSGKRESFKITRKGYSFADEVSA
uniref:DUF4062 domain-containing protein n=1 Tax=Desulfovibrio sp. U5L TaxID=596152 RepID=I2Q6G0_9BACT